MSIELKSATKVYGALTAVDSINLDIQDGEVLCLLGPSGCGKTTTLRMIAGLEPADNGEIYIGGKQVNNLSARDRNVAMSFQFYALYPSQSVAKNLAFPLFAEGLSRADIDAKVQETSRVLQLDGILERLPGQLAEGEKQRVAVGRSIIRNPTCFLFDEPLSRLDVQLREEMRGEIKEVLQGLSKPTVIVTHDQLEALTMADRIAVMRAGQIEQVDTPHNVFSRPANLFVAGFIGTPQMNLLPATFRQATSDGKGEFVIDQHQSITLTLDEHFSEIKDGSSVTLGIRPRNLNIISEPRSDSITLPIDLIEPMGAETLAHLKDGEQDLRVVTDWKVPLTEGEHVHAQFMPGSVHVFANNEQRVTTL
ncbi:MAG: ABC transporter ATP-binding protein [Gammaproteobacteria bacterium]|nr:ABC transporter ATP-binding protein [Gammaproteobacteria bacterium]